MRNKILVQFTLFIFFVTIVFFFYYKYFFSQKDNTISQKENFENLNQESNLIKDIEYLSVDTNGNKYLIISEYGEINKDNSDIMSMKNGTAKIELFEKDTIYISSLSAKYNTQNYETNFDQNVELEYLNHTIYAENLDLSFQKNYAWLYTNVIYKDLYYDLLADKIEIDLITKNSKIFMNNKKKLKIIKK